MLAGILPAIFASFEVITFKGHQLFVLLASDLVNRFYKVLGHMNFVKGDLLVGSQQGVQRCIDEFGLHIHGEAFYS
jgi:hypothetical protein